MKTVLNIKTDKDVKEKAQLLARHLGIPLSTVVNAQLKSFIESGGLTLTREPQLRPEVIAELNKVIQEVQHGKNMSPHFKTATEAIAWLNT